MKKFFRRIKDAIFSVQYFRNIRDYVLGFAWLFTHVIDLEKKISAKELISKLPTIHYAPGWNSWKFLPVYIIDVGPCVIFLAGGVETLSSFFHRHRSGKLWDKVLDVIERFDPGHGAQAGEPLWGTKECSKRVRRLVPLCWLLFFCGLYLWRKMG